MLPSVKAEASARHLQEAGTSILQQGAVLASGLFSPAFIAELHEEVATCIEQVMARQVPGRIMTLGNKRLHITLQARGPFLRPEFYAQPFFDQLCRGLLGNDCIVATIAVAISYPGAVTHHPHRDQHMLFNDERIDPLLPPVSLCLAVPLVPITPDCGATALVPGSHRDSGMLKRIREGEQVAAHEPELAPGDAMIWDNRLVHWGLANTSATPRPLLLVYVQRPWFRNLNLASPESALQIRREDLDTLSPPFRARFAWRHTPLHQEPVTTQPVTRLSPCPCGSGERYKSCCGATALIARPS